MAEKGQTSVNTSVRAQLLAGAYDAATVAVEKRTTLRGASARRVAVETVNAAMPKVQAEHSAGLIDSGPETIIAGLSAVALLAVDLVVFGAVAARGPRWARGLAVVSAAGHVGLVTFAKVRQRRIKAAAGGLVKPAMAAPTRSSR